MAEKKNTDYSASAVKLCNPPEVEGLLRELQNEQTALNQLQNQADASIPEAIKVSISATQVRVEILSKNIRQAIDDFGSFQNVDKGSYAVKQRKLSKSYNAESFEKTYPQFSPAVIIKAVDTTKLNGLLKGGLLDEARLEADGVLKISESFAYIIR